MKYFWMVLITLSMVPPALSQTRQEEQEREAMQAELDLACEVARQEKLSPLKARYIEECVEKEQRPDRESCERFYADYGNRSGNRAPLFYDLPECVTAFEHRKN